MVWCNEEKRARILIQREKFNCGYCELVVFDVCCDSCGCVMRAVITFLYISTIFPNLGLTHTTPK